MAVRPFDEIFRDFVTDGVPSSGPHHPYKPDIRDSLNAIVRGAFPDNRVIKLNNANEGTENEIVVSASVDIPTAVYQVLYVLNVTQENTGPVTVSGAINRKLVTNTSQPIPAGYLKPSMAVLCIDTGSELRMLSYGDVESSVEDLVRQAEAALADAEQARDQAQNAASDAVSQGNVPIYSTRNAVETLEIPDGITAVRINGDQKPGDGYTGMFVEVDDDPGSLDSRFKFQEKGGRWFKKVIQSGRPDLRYGRIVVLGSSTAAGMGTSTYTADPGEWNGWTETPQCWVGLMRAAMGADAEIINRSLSGSNTFTSVKRFWTDVALYNPDTVVICTGWNNEPSASNPFTRARAYLQNILKLVSYCERIGAVPIVIAAQPGPWADFRRQLDVAMALKSRGIKVIDLSTSLSARGQQTIKPVFQSDAIHANDLGHARYFQDVPLSAFEIASRVNGLLKQVQPLASSGAMLRILPYSATSPGGNSNLTASYNPSDSTYGGSAKNWSISVRVRGNQASGNQSGLIVNAQAFQDANKNLSIRPNGANWALYVSAVARLTSTVAWDKSGFTNVLICYDSYEDRLDYYHDTTYVGSINPGWEGLDFNVFQCGALGTSTYRLTGWDIASFTVFRNCISNSPLLVTEFLNRGGLTPFTEMAVPGVVPFETGSMFPNLADDPMITVYGYDLALQWS